MNSKSDKKNIDHRLRKIDYIDHNIRMTAVEKSRQQKSYQVTLDKLVQRRKFLRKEKDDIEKEIIDVEKSYDKLVQLLRDLDNGNSPIITEHAYLRYIERVMGIDLDEVHEKILKMDKKDLYIAGKTIVTVMPSYDDHFNLAERESI